MSDFEVKFCGNKKVSVVDDKPYNRAQIASLEKQIKILSNMIYLLEVKDLILAYVEKYSELKGEKLQELTGTESVEEAKEAADDEQWETASDYARKETINVLYPGQSFVYFLGLLVSKFDELDPAAYDNWEEKGVAETLEDLLGLVSRSMNELSGKLDKDTMRMLRECDNEWDDLNPMSLETANVVSVRDGLIELLEFKGSTFELKSDARETLAAEAAPEEVEPSTEDSMRAWMDSRRWFPEIRLTVGGTMDLAQSDDLARAKEQSGEPTSVKQPMTGTVDWSAQLEWNRLYPGEHQLTISPYYVGRTRGLGGENATEHRVGVMAEAQNLSPADYIPGGSLTLEYNENSSDVPNFPHPEEKNFRAKGTMNERLYGPLSLDVADTLSLGERNGYDYTRNVLSLGPRLTGRKASVAAGYRSLYFTQDTGINVSVEGQDLPAWRSGEQENKGDGFYFELDAHGPRDAFSASAYADFMEEFEDEGGASAYYEHAFDWGTPYLTANFKQENLNNGTNRTIWGDLGVNLDFIPFVTLRPHVYAGWQRFDYREDAGMRDAAGLVGGGGLEVAASTKKNEPAIEERIERLNSSSRSGAPLAGKARAASKNDTAMVYDDPMVRALITREPSAFAVASYLIAFKAGKLNADYTFDGYYADLEDQAVKVDGTDALYRGDENGVKMGDVAPVEFYVGGETSVKPNLSSTFYYPTLYRLTPEKRQVLEIAVARQELATGKEKLAVKLPNEASVIAKDLLEALTVIYREDSDALFTPDELKKELDALVVGENVMGAVKIVLKKMLKEAKGADLSTGELGAIGGLRVIGRDLVDVITAYAYSKTGEGEDQGLPRYEELCEMLGVTADADAPGPDADGEESEIGPR